MKFFIDTANLDDIKEELVWQDIKQDLIVIDENEAKNLRSLSNLYSEMKAPAAVKVLSELEIETVVKILSLMPADASAKILETMTDMSGELSAGKAAEITEAIRDLQ